MQNLKKYLPIILLFFSTFFILRQSFSQNGMYITHDGEIHILRSINFKDELLQGQIPVRMIPQQAYSFGYAIFNFFYPLPAYITAGFQLSGFSTVLSFKLMQALITVLSVLIFYFWMKKHFDTASALTATIVYTLVPFRILTLYVTGQLGGYYALLFAPMIGLGLYNLLKTKNGNGSILAVGIAGMITSHLLSAIIFFFPLLGYFIFLAHKTISKQMVLKVLFWSIIGFGLSSFYFIPFMLEKSWIQLGHKILVDHRDHWPTLKQLLYSPWAYGHSNSGPNDGMTFQIGLSIYISLATSIILLFKKKNLFGSILVATFLLLFFLLTPYSAPVWEVFVPLQLIQFPWRLLAATSLVGAALVGWSSSKLTGKYKNLYILLIIFISFYNVRNYVQPWPLDWRTDSDYYNNKQALHGPTDISWELMPIGATQVPSSTPEFITNASDEAIIDYKIETPSQGDIRKIISIQTKEETQIIFALWDLPVWEVYLNDEKVRKAITDEGTIAILVPEGSHTIKIELVQTNVQKVSNYISLFSVILIVVHVLKTRKKHARTD